MLRKVYALFGLAVVVLYGGAVFFGRELMTPKAETIPPNYRNSPGGYRSFHFWHSGVHGGK